MQILLFLGAGASRDFGIPITRELIESLPSEMHKLYRAVEEKDSSLTVEDFLRYLSDVANFESTPAGIELLDFLGYSKRGVIELEAKKISTRILESLCTQTETSKEMIPSASEAYGKLFDPVMEQYSAVGFDGKTIQVKEYPDIYREIRLNIFTTNYDDVVEKVCAHRDFPCYRGINPYSSIWQNEFYRLNDEDKTLFTSFSVPRTITINKTGNQINQEEEIDEDYPNQALIKTLMRKLIPQSNITEYDDDDGNLISRIKGAIELKKYFILPGINYFKLHGSRNWIRSNGKTSEEFDPNCDRERRMIYPTNMLDAYYEPFSILYSHFIDKVGKANYIFVIGSKLADPNIAEPLRQRMANGNARMWVISPNASSNPEVLKWEGSITPIDKTLIDWVKDGAKEWVKALREIRGTLENPLYSCLKQKGPITFNSKNDPALENYPLEFRARVQEIERDDASNIRFEIVNGEISIYFDYS